MTGRATLRRLPKAVSSWDHRSGYRLAALLRPSRSLRISRSVSLRPSSDHVRWRDDACDRWQLEGAISDCGCRANLLSVSLAAVPEISINSIRAQISLHISCVVFLLPIRVASPFLALQHFVSGSDWPIHPLSRDSGRMEGDCGEAAKQLT